MAVASTSSPGQHVGHSRILLFEVMIVLSRSYRWLITLNQMGVPGGRGPESPAPPFFYLVAVMDWATRTVLSWRLSNTLDTAFCREALQEALAGYGRPEIFNTD